MKILLTGCAGFIGFHVARALLGRGDYVVGIDNLNDYYDPRLKQARLGILRQCSEEHGEFHFLLHDLCDLQGLSEVFKSHKIDRVIHLAAQAGVRHSIENPHQYVQSNIVAFTNILEVCRHNKIAHLVYASTSSVYGGNVVLPFKESAGVDHPLQFYAATKRANELMAHSYSHLFGLPTTGLRFFTVYGPWGRPDMALFKFVKCIVENRPIELFNDGKHSRDFTYIDDIVQGIVKSCDDIPSGGIDNYASLNGPATSPSPFRLFNVGNGTQVSLMSYVRAIESRLQKTATIKFLPLQPGDVSDTFADISLINETIGYKPETSVIDGVSNFVDWYLDYHEIET